ncbi:MAG: DMT family transporter [Acetobacteraceae bacterium]|nr:DMT family transporter [Acetobacteraceae bacterium]
MTDRQVGLACAFAVLLIWAGFLLASRLAAKQDFTPWDVAALRYAGAFLTAVPVCLWRGWPRLPIRRALGLAATAGIGFPIAAYAGLGFAPAAHGAVLLPGLLPFLAAALWWWAFGERWTRARWLSLGLVGLGIGLLASDSFGDHPGAWRGDLLFVAGCASWAAYMGLICRWGVPPLDATLAIALLCAPIFLPVWWLLLPSRMEAAGLGPVLFQLAYQGAIALVLAGLLFTVATVKLGGPTTTAITSVVPVLVALAAWPLLGEALGLAGLLGVALVTLGMVVGVGRLR